MARNAEAAPYTSNLWQKLVSSAYHIGRPAYSIYLSFWLEIIYNLAALEAVLSPVSTVAFSVTIFQRETTRTHDILVLSLIAIGTVVAAVVLALQTRALNSSLDVQAILKTRPDLSSGVVLSAWGRFIGGKLPLVAFILFLVAGGFQIVTVSARHLIKSSKRLPKQFQPFVMEKQKSMSTVGEPEASTLGTELVAGVNPGPLARLFDDYEKRGLISTQIDLKSFNREDLYITRIMEGNRRRRAFQEGITDEGPQFTLFDRYWVSQRNRSSPVYKIIAITVYILAAISFQTARFALTLRSSQPCQWACILGVTYPWLLAIWVATVLISIQRRLALQRKVFGIIRIDRLLTISFTTSCLLGTVYASAWLYTDIGDVGGTVFTLWEVGNFAICCTVTAFLLVEEIVTFLYGRLFFFSLL